MKLLGLNSPELFIILVVFLSILGPKRIEKSLLLFKKILKFLLSKEEPISAVGTMAFFNKLVFDFEMESFCAVNFGGELISTVIKTSIK